jgi:hypothetical protein
MILKILLQIMRLEIQDLKELFENEISIKYRNIFQKILSFKLTGTIFPNKKYKFT